MLVSPADSPNILQYFARSLDTISINWPFTRVDAADPGPFPALEASIQSFISFQVACGSTVFGVAVRQLM